uniref:C2 domain-containing protein n=1 Tax=Chromera velia CCMP2878 TaxID=1169474 RepID=A0A0G4HVY6_9ALVE|eukprot:Cvel_8960.t1-p1 / transcript=Cvel_8960.t1 / gene=Cvel_8960 / organism=Chromera_velia_CCMP2878 / gene_product=hypothetical protein / transcript_product=hypothetical protein / location=Cvel_scaffold505:21693-26321(-) / protein_length=886 / sequence_SO=supercontig / SO=protein_coding / is_pseudo=false
MSWFSQERGFSHKAASLLFVFLFCLLLGGSTAEETCNDFEDVIMPIDLEQINEFGVSVSTAEIETSPGSFQCLKISHDLSRLPPVQAVQIRVNATAPHVLMAKFNSNPNAFNYDVVDFCSWLDGSNSSLITVLSDEDLRGATFFEEPLYVGLWWRPRGQMRQFVEKHREMEAQAKLRGKDPPKSINELWSLTGTVTTTIQFQLTEEWKQEHADLNRYRQRQRENGASRKSEGGASDDAYSSDSEWGDSSSSSSSLGHFSLGRVGSRLLQSTTQAKPPQQQQKEKEKDGSLVTVSSPHSENHQGPHSPHSSADPLAAAFGDVSCHYFEKFVDLHTLIRDVERASEGIPEDESKKHTPSFYKHKEIERRLDSQTDEGASSLDMSTEEEEGEEARQLTAAASSSKAKGVGGKAKFPFPITPMDPSPPPIRLVTFDMTGLRADPDELAFCRKTGPPLKGQKPENWWGASDPCDTLEAPAHWRQQVEVKPGEPLLLRIAFFENGRDAAPDASLFKRNRGGPSLLQQSIAEEGVTPGRPISPVVTLKGLKKGVRVLGLLDRSKDVLEVDSARCLRPHYNEWHPKAGSSSSWFGRRRLDAAVASSSLADDNYGPSVLAFSPLTEEAKGTVLRASGALVGKGAAYPKLSQQMEVWLDAELKECRGESRRLSVSTSSSSSNGPAHSLVLIFADEPVTLEANVAYWFQPTHEDPKSPNADSARRWTTAAFLLRVIFFIAVAVLVLGLVRFCKTNSNKEDRHPMQGGAFSRRSNSNSRHGRRHGGEHEMGWGEGGEAVSRRFVGGLQEEGGDSPSSSGALGGGGGATSAATAGEMRRMRQMARGGVSNRSSAAAAEEEEEHDEAVDSTDLLGGGGGATGAAGREPEGGAGTDGALCD